MARAILFVLLAAILASCAGNAWADVYTFATAGTDWSVSGDWTPSGPPGSGDTAVMAPFSDYWIWTVTLGGDQSVAGLVIPATTHKGYTFGGAGNTLTLGAGGLVIDNANEHVFNCIVAGANTSITLNSSSWENFNNGWDSHTNWLTLANASNSFTGSLSILGGVLLVGSDSAMGNSSNVLTLGSTGAFGTLDAYNNSSFSTSRAIALAGEGGAFDPNYGYLNVNGPIAGSGGLILFGAGGRIAVTGTADNSYTGGTRIWQTGAVVGMDTGGNNQTSNDVLGSGNLRVEFGGAVTMNSAGDMAPNATVYVGSYNMGSFDSRSIFIGEGFVPNFTSGSGGAFFWEGNSSAAINARLAYGQPQLGNGHMAYGGGGSAAGGLAFTNGQATFTGTSLMADEIDHVYRFYGNIFYTLNSVLNDNDPAYHYGVDAIGGCVLIGGENNTFSGTILATGVDNGIGWGGIVWLQQGTLNPLNTPLGSATGDIVLSRFGQLKIEPQVPNPNTSQPDAQLPIVKGNVYFNGVGLIDVSSPYQYWHSELDVNGLVRNDRSVLYIMGQGSGGNSGFLGTDSNNAWGWASPGAEILKVTNAPATYNNNTMVAPYYVAYNTIAGSMMDFLNYGANGFVVAAYTVGGNAQAVASQADFNNTVSTDIVNITAPVNTNSAPMTVYAVRAAADISGSNALTISSGGLIAIDTRTISAPVTFGSAEGLVYANNGNSVYLQGGIAGTNGLTFSAGSPDNGGAGAIFYVYGHNSGFSGQVTINGGIMSFQYADSLGADSNSVLVNGGSFCPGYTGNVNRAITLGIAGGQIGGYWNGGGYNDHYTQPITGPGTLTVPWWAGGVYLDAVNSYSGGTRVYNQMYVDIGATTGGLADGSAGGGPIELVNGGRLYVYGTAGISQSQRVSLLREDTWLFVSCNGTLAIGSLEGYGTVALNDTSGARLFDSTLSIGGDNTSTDFYGQIRNNDYSGGYGGEVRGGNIVKVGTGTLTLGGNNIYTGTTTVTGGVLNVTGSIAAPPSPNNTADHSVYVNGGTLTGTGLVARNVYVNSGTLAGSLTVDGSVTSAGAITGIGTINGSVTTTGSLNAAGTINGALAANGGIVLGTTAINGNVTVSGAAFSGTHSITGNVALNTGTVAGTSTIVGTVDVEGGTFGGTNTITGNVTVASGGLGSVTGASTIAGNVDVYAGGSLAGGHNITGNLATHGDTILNPSDTPGTAMTLTVVGNVTLDPATVLNFGLATPGLDTGGAANDFLAISGSGNLMLDGTLNILGSAPFTQGTYRLMNYTGTLTDNGLAIGAKPDSNLLYTIQTGGGHVNLIVNAAYVPGDVNHDGAVNTLDLDDIYRHFGTGSSFAQWDVNGDGTVNQADVTFELTDTTIGLKTEYGDANLDHKVNFTDFQVLLDHWQATGGVWATGDFNGDTVVNFGDFQKLLDYWNPAGYGASVPEPTTLVLLGLGAIGLIRRKR